MSALTPEEKLIAIAAEIERCEGFVSQLSQPAAGSTYEVSIRRTCTKQIKNILEG